MVKVPAASDVVDGEGNMPEDCSSGLLHRGWKGACKKGRSALEGVMYVEGDAEDLGEDGQVFWTGKKRSKAGNNFTTQLSHATSNLACGNYAHSPTNVV